MGDEHFVEDRLVDRLAVDGQAQAQELDRLKATIEDGLEDSGEAVLVRHAEVTEAGQRRGVHTQHRHRFGFVSLDFVRNAQEGPVTTDGDNQVHTHQKLLKVVQAFEDDDLDAQVAQRLRHAGERGDVLIVRLLHIAHAGATSGNVCKLSLIAQCLHLLQIGLFDQEQHFADIFHAGLSS